MSGSVRRIWVGLAIFGFSLGIRTLFVGLELRGHSIEQIITFNWDSREYVHLGHNLATTGHYADDANPDAEARRVSHFFGLLRTPGYPVLLAIAERWGSLAIVLWVQVLMGALVPVGVWQVGRALLGSERVAGVAAILSALSSTGIGACGMFLVDTMFGFCVIAAWWMLVRAVRRGRYAGYIGAGIMLGVGVLVKPTLFYWPLTLPVVAWLLGRALARPVAWGGVALMCLLPVMAVGSWCWRNLRVEGGWMYCIVDAQNLRHFVGPLTEECARLGQEPTADDLLRNQDAVRSRDWDDMANGRLTALELGKRQRAETLQIVRRHPLVAARCVLNCAWDNWGNGWPYTRDEVSNAPWLKWPVMEINAGWYLLARLLGIPLVLVALLEPVLAGDGLGDPQRRRRFFALLAMLVTFGYFLALCGTSYSIGFRTLYPAEFALLLMMAAGVAATARLVKPRAPRVMPAHITD